MRLSARLQPSDFEGPFASWRRFAEQRMERAALIAVDQGRRVALGNVRSDMQGAGLGRLGNALGSNSDLSRGRGVHRNSRGFSASGALFIRSGSDRSRGAIEAYTQGAEIQPVRSRWLWIPTDNIPRVSMRYRMTPALWNQNGLNQRIGPLVTIRSVNGNPLLIVKNVGVDLTGRKRSAKSLTKAGYPRKGQVEKEFLVAFIGIPRTSRAARVNVKAIMEAISADLPALFEQALGKI